MAAGSQAIGSGRPVSPEKVVNLLVDSALVAKLLADYPDAERRLDRAFFMAGAAGQAEAGRRALAEKAALYYVWGRFDQGLELAGRVVSEGGGEPSENQASALNTSGNIHLRRCEFDSAEKCFRQALDNYRSLGREIFIGTVINNLANIYNIRGDYERAKQLYLQALERFESCNDIFRISHVLHSLGQITLARKEVDLARQYLERSLALRNRIQDYRGIVNNLLIQIGMLTDQREFAGAEDRLAQADAIIREHNLTDPHLKVYRDGEAGILYFLSGDYGRAEQCFLELIALSEKMGLAAFSAGGHSWLGKTRVFRDCSPEGIADILKGVEQSVAGNLPYELKNARLYLVESYCRLGQAREAEEAALEYVEEAAKQGAERRQAEQEIRAVIAEGLKSKVT